MGTNDNNEKLGQMGSRRGHVTYFLEFWDPLHISGTVRAVSYTHLRAHETGRLTTGGTNDNNEKLGQMGSGRGHVTYF